jgi:RNA polymerase sigma factor (TIGR02999 family)
VSDEHDLTQLIRRAAGGDLAAREDFVTLVYDEIHRLAKNHLRHQRPGHSFQATDLVNLTYLKLFPAGSASPDWRDRQHFFAVVSQAIRWILADHARGRSRLKRKAEGDQVLLDEILANFTARNIDVVAVHEALQELAGIDRRMVQIVDLKVFGGYLNKEIAELLDISLRTVERDWGIARAWLRDRIGGDRGGSLPAADGEPPAPTQAPA